MSLDIRPLRVLDSIMSTGSVTDAAHMMHRTQPQISRILRSLEGDLGFELFERHGRRMVPTARGRAFHAHARKLLDEAEALTRVAETVRMTREQTLRVASPAYAAHLLVPSAVAAMSERHADLDFEVSTIRRLPAGDDASDFDVAIVALPFERSGLTVQPIAQVEFVALLPADHRLAELETLQHDDFGGENFVAINWESQMRHNLDPFFGRMHGSLHIRATTNTSATACQLVARGLGVGVGDPLVAVGFAKENLVLRRMVPTVTYTLGAVYSTDTAPGPFIREFIGRTLEAACALAPDFVTPI